MRYRAAIPFFDGGFQCRAQLFHCLRLVRRGQVRIAERHFDLPMAEDFLYRRQIDAAHGEIACRRMAEIPEAKALDARRFASLPKCVVDRRPAYLLAPGPHETGIPRIDALKPLHGLSCRPIQGNRLELSVLGSAEVNQRAIKVHILVTQLQ